MTNQTPDSTSDAIKILSKLLGTHGVQQEIVDGVNYAFERCADCKDALAALTTHIQKEVLAELKELETTAHGGGNWRRILTQKIARVEQSIKQSGGRI